MTDRLPKDVVVDDEEWPRCPWCTADMIEATVTVGQISDAWSHWGAMRPERGPNGEPDPIGIVADCPTCCRPSMIALQEHDGPYPTRHIRLLAVRTPADLKLLNDTAGGGK
ncbi:hypothetical protein [Phenylobacterium sp.]|uniref:hypothetical protein n=1 Tax=Phenylobacterium sp. TaxID=1871053 RepID=UPI002DEA453F|nr:hypothetical protein [Phenylobacterium sp.]